MRGLLRLLQALLRGAYCVLLALLRLCRCQHKRNAQQPQALRLRLRLQVQQLLNTAAVAAHRALAPVPQPLLST